MPAAADPAVLVHVHADLRVSLAQLASENDTVLAARYVVTRLATGCIDLHPATEDPTAAPSGPAAGDPVETPARFLTMRTDARSRLALTRGLVHRVAVKVGDKVLVTLVPDTGALRLLNLGTLADAVESCLAAADTATEVPS